MQRKQPNKHTIKKKFIFFWKDCLVCEQQYRFELMWRFFVRQCPGIEYLSSDYKFICQDCALSEPMANRIATNHIETINSISPGADRPTMWPRRNEAPDPSQKPPPPPAPPPVSKLPN